MEAERVLGFALPQAYREFLDVNGGGHSQHYVLDLPGMHGEFFLWGGIIRGESYRGPLLQDLVRNTRGLIDQQHMPFAFSETNDFAFIPREGDPFVCIWDSIPPTQVFATKLALPDFLDALVPK